MPRDPDIREAVRRRYAEAATRFAARSEGSCCGPAAPTDRDDAETYEGTGFAFASAAQGIPWLIIRGISDTPWWPNAFDGVLASDHAAQVAIHIVENLPSGAVSEVPATFSDLSPASNAAQAGYIVASQADYTVSPVGAVTYSNQQGVTQTIPNFQFSRLGAEYRYPWTPPTG